MPMKATGRGAYLVPRFHVVKPPGRQPGGELQKVTREAREDCDLPGRDRRPQADESGLPRLGDVLLGNGEVVHNRSGGEELDAGDREVAYLANACGRGVRKRVRVQVEMA